LRPVDDINTIFSAFQGLPRDHYKGNFISQSKDKEGEYLKIVREVRTLLENWVK
jgi:DNA-directed RNA polymerase subunit H (RpoH/RPB5)